MKSIKPISLCLLSYTVFFSSAAFSFRPADEIYQENCANCHGKNLEGGMGSSLVDDEWKHGSDATSVYNSIAKGFPNAGMPGWEEALSTNEIRSLVVYIKEQKNRNLHEKIKDKFQSEDGIFDAGGYKFKLEKVDEIEGIIWALDFLPDGSILGTDRGGALWHFKDGEKTKIKDTPTVWRFHQGGLLDVAVHPDYEKNGWVYLTFSDHQGKMVDGEKAGMTKVVRGKIKDHKWHAEESILSVDKSYHNTSGSHFGSRIVFKDGYIYFSVGDRRQDPLAQDTSRVNGKIIRLHDDGKIPKDNPFMPSDSRITGAIWSYGHRNPQGLAIHPKTGDVWEAEHGPRGGDEINLIEKGKNYGWPVITYGIDYDGTPISELTEKEGMEQPVHYWVPSIAVSSINFYQGELFKQWVDKLLVASLGSQELHLLTIEGDKVVKDEILLKGQGRIREVLSGPDGAVYLSINDGKGSIYKMLPVKEQQ